jgi:hypothetical protein
VTESHTDSKIRTATILSFYHARQVYTVIYDKKPKVIEGKLGG